MTGAVLSAPVLARSGTVIARLRKPVAAVALILGILFVTSSWIHLEVPRPTGSHLVGRQEFLWTDSTRPESATPNSDDHRQTGLVVWYPAASGTGTPAPYVPDLEGIKAGLVESGELSSILVTGLRWVRTNSLQDAAVDTSATGYPLLLLSPGNATNVEFYASLAEDLASNGYVVVGLNHPFQVTAMSLSDGSTAVYDASSDAGAGSQATKIAERVADVEFVLRRLTEEVASSRFLDGKVDMSRVGVLGHSNGGLTATEACRASDIVAACMNIDGQAASGPFGTASEPSPVGDPFMYLTKEAELHPVLAATFEQSGKGTFRVVVPAATHAQFGDGALFEPGFWPFQRTADEVQIVTKGFALAFFDQYLSGSVDRQLDIVDAPTDVYLFGYPLGTDQPTASEG